MLREEIEKLFIEAINKGIAASQLGELKEAPKVINIETPKNPEHGDKAVGVAMQLAKEAKLPPRKIAEVIVENIDKTKLSNIEIAGPGFINLSVSWDMFEAGIASIHEQDSSFGRHSKEQRPDHDFEKVLIEYVSANPTGDLHLGHGRQAVLGSALESLFDWAGYYVESEFYINDAGVQIAKLGESAERAMKIVRGEMDPSDYGEDLYPLESMKEFLKPEMFEELESKFKKAVSDIEKNPKMLNDLEKVETLNRMEMDQSFYYAETAKNIFLKHQKDLLKDISVEFKTWFSEKTLYQESKPGAEDSDLLNTIRDLEKAGLIYEQEGAKWFKSKDLGDERDRVIRKSDGTYTYLSADIAYHQNKLARSFDKLITIWGADHHGQIPSLKGALTALGEPSERLEIVLVQMVSMKEGDQEFKMSKRAGKIVTVRELIDEVGADAFRYFLIESQANNRIAFDLSLAKKQDKDNPVYYIQYAHARCCSILRTVTNPQLDQDQMKELAPVLSKEDLDKLLIEFKNSQSRFTQFDDLSEEEKKSTKALIIHLLNFPQEIGAAALHRAPHRIANYLKDTAALFHQFYTHNRVISDNQELMKARLTIVVATQKVLRNGLQLLGISAPEKM